MTAGSSSVHDGGPPADTESPVRTTEPEQGRRSDESPAPRSPVPPGGTVLPQDGGPGRISRRLTPPDPSAPLVDLELLIVVGCGAAIGALARWGLAQMLPAGDGLFPWATYLTNVIGSFALGLLVGLAERVWPHTRVPRLFLGVGVLGGFTTFSTAVVESVLLVEADRAGLALAYVTGSLIACVAAAVIGTVIAGAVASRSGRADRAGGGPTIVHDGTDRP